MSKRRRVRTVPEPEQVQVAQETTVHPELERSAIELELGPGEIIDLEPTRPIVGDVVLYTRSRVTWPAMIVALYADDVADLVVWHEPRGGSCSTFAARVPQTASDLLRGGEAGWQARVRAGTLAREPLPAAPPRRLQ